LCSLLNPRFLGSDSPFLHFYFDKDDTFTLLKTSYSFDDLDRLNSIEYKKASNNALIRKFNYSYNLQNFIETQEVYDSSSSLIEWKEYEYDNINRLAKVKTKDTGTGQITDTYEFLMDDVGNLT